DQATGRAHRFGQKKVVQVIRLLAEGTIEEKIYELQQKKRELIDTVIQPGEKMLTGLSEEDIKELLNIYRVCSRMHALFLSCYKYDTILNERGAMEAHNHENSQ